MTGQPNVAPIIKRKKIIEADGHHGGAWKVAYADFVTAMMAFFMMMWLLNATTEKQRRGIADYFSPNVPINRQSAGGDGMFSGDTIFAENVLARNGTGASDRSPTIARQARGITDTSITGSDRPESDVLLKVEDALLGRGGESEVSDDLLSHIITRVTDEGLVIELFDLDTLPLFDGDTSDPTPVLRDLARLIQRVSGRVTNQIALGGHVASYPIVRADNPVWPLSANRADKMRTLLIQAGMEADRIRRVTGHADRSPVVSDPMARRNNRLEVILLR